MDNVDVFWKFTSAQVQIIDDKGRVLMDSIGMVFEDELDTPDVRRPCWKDEAHGSAGCPTQGKWLWSGKPLKSQDDTVGVLRFITSLTPINEQIKDIIKVFSLIGVLTIALTGIISFVLANGVVGPIKRVTKVAEEMAKGDFNVEAQKSPTMKLGACQQR